MNNTIVKHPLASGRGNSYIIILLLNGASPLLIHKGTNAGNQKKLWLRYFHQHICIATIAGA